LRQLLQLSLVNTKVERSLLNKIKIHLKEIFLLNEF